MKDLLDRTRCCMCNSPVVEFCTIPKFPVFASSVSQDFDLDIFADQVWGECSSCYLIQLMALVPLNVLYSQNHNSEVVGKTWGDHHTEFADFIHHYESREVLEVGASHGHLAELLTSRDSELSYTMIDPNLGGLNLLGVTRISGFIEDNIELIGGTNVVMSHVLEHLYNPGDFLKLLSENMKCGDKFFLSSPQIYEWLRIDSPNALNFEHSYFFCIDQVEAMLAEFGFELLQQERFKSHSVFSVFEKRDLTSIKREKYVNSLDHKKEFQNYVSSQIDFCKYVNDSLMNIKGNVYLYGASLFGQALLCFGMTESAFIGVLDNSRSKKGERLYGSHLAVISPEEISRLVPLTVVLRMGPYQNEIRDQLKQINQFVNILE